MRKKTVFVAMILVILIRSLLAQEPIPNVTKVEFKSAGRANNYLPRDPNEGILPVWFKEGTKVKIQYTYTDDGKTQRGKQANLNILGRRLEWAVSVADRTKLNIVQTEEKVEPANGFAGVRFIFLGYPEKPKTTLTVVAQDSATGNSLTASIYLVIDEKRTAWPADGENVTPLDDVVTDLTGQLIFAAVLDRYKDQQEEIEIQEGQKAKLTFKMIATSESAKFDSAQAVVEIQRLEKEITALSKQMNSLDDEAKALVKIQTGKAGALRDRLSEFEKDEGDFLSVRDDVKRDVDGFETRFPSPRPENIDTLFSQVKGSFEVLRAAERLDMKVVKQRITQLEKAELTGTSQLGYIQRQTRDFGIFVGLNGEVYRIDVIRWTWMPNIELGARFHLFNIAANVGGMWGDPSYFVYGAMVSVNLPHRYIQTAVGFQLLKQVYGGAKKLQSDVEWHMYEALRLGFLVDVPVPFVSTIHLRASTLWMMAGEKSGFSASAGFSINF